MSKTSRNDPCPCGSGKKFKQCCIDKSPMAGASRTPAPNAQQQFQLAAQAFQRGRMLEAEVAAKAAAQLSPKKAEVHHLLAAIYQGTRRWSEAQEAIRVALSLDPRHPHILFTAGSIAADLGQLDLAIERFQAAVKRQPDLVEAWFNLGNALRDAGKPAAAVEAYRAALKVRPTFVEALCNLGDVLRQRSQYADAVQLYRSALQIQPQSGAIHAKLGLALQRLSQLDEALAAYQRACELSPGDAQTHSNWLLASQYDPTLSAQDLFARHLNFAARFEQPMSCPSGKHAEWSWDGVRPLRIGYVSPDLRKHSVAQFAEPVIGEHDRQRFEVHAYYSNSFEDEVTKRIRAKVAVWHDASRLGDDELAQQIEADGIDILVDLSGHTAGHRLLVFTKRPAPIQVTWLGYPGTTGLSCMDYRLSDECLDPPGRTEAFYTETLVRLPTYSQFSPPENAPEVGPLPACAGAGVTFACLNNTTKINAQVLALWARVLLAVPHSRLILGNANEPSWCEWVVSHLVSHGIDAARIEFKPRLAANDYLALHQQIDLALDPFPWNGGTTSMLSLWMGVPVITVAGDRPASRLGLSSLHYAGLDEFAAESLDGYVELARQWAANLEGLAGIRSTLRARMCQAAQQPRLDVVRSVERAYEDMARHKMLNNSSN